jgi:Mannosylglycerate hydrolase MGH1-like glycoside hydrolase domain
MWRERETGSGWRTGRRDFLRLAGMAAGGALLAGKSEAAAVTPKGPAFPSGDGRWQKTWDAALAVLAGNLRTVPRYPEPVLIEGAVYPGVWQECGPHEGLVYGTLAQFVAVKESGSFPLEIARNNHMAFFALQKPVGADSAGQIPSAIKMTEVGFGQIQMVVPIASTAWELAQLMDDDELLVTAYSACSRWDAWLRQYRDTRKTGLVEGFCTYDTGHDNSPRWAGIPNRCPDADARKCPPIAGMPRLCPDLSATVFGARMALAHMATALGKGDEASRWHEDAETIRQLIIEHLYDPKDASFYDLDTQNNFVRVRSDVNSRVLGEHVLKRYDAKDKAIFDAVWTKQIHNPKAFWAPYPLTSIAMDDPAFVRPIPRNSWGGASQALTALRAPRWMPYYGKQTELNHMMTQWCEAIMRHTEFRQQMDPMTGDFTQADPSGYSPAALVFLDYARRLSHSAV